MMLPYDIVTFASVSVMGHDDDKRYNSLFVIELSEEDHPKDKHVCMTHRPQQQALSGDPCALATSLVQRRRYTVGQREKRRTTGCRPWGHAVKRNVSAKHQLCHDDQCYEIFHVDIEHLQ